MAKQLGLSVQDKYNMDESDIKELLKAKRPVIVCFQAWGDEEDYKDREYGHYGIVIGCDEKNVYFQDSGIEKKRRGHLPWKEFMRRWKDKDSDGNKDRYGIAFWKEGGAKEKETVKKSQRIK